ncbi:MAG: type II toxin-antitoxin system YafQ family toxin [Methylovulum miyakonense]|uniref:type II toxin-antitoxin system YafQ family toxin n=1 Tax=Methylovulum miyakonense TaxID=645578 RepID=UPI003BB6FB3E
MYTAVYLNRFEKDLKRMQKRGKDMGKFKQVVLKLMAGEVLEPRYFDHWLIDNFASRRECHLEPDWLLIYRFEADKVIFERTGTHTDLFK